eukprot:1180692-Prorocentrum_minimum.AAC.2
MKNKERLYSQSEPTARGESKHSYVGVKVSRCLRACVYSCVFVCSCARTSSFPATFKIGIRVDERRGGVYYSSWGDPRVGNVSSEVQLTR